jgi:hypothetical protein
VGWASDLGPTDPPDSDRPGHPNDDGDVYVASPG